MVLGLFCLSKSDTVWHSLTQSIEVILRLFDAIEVTFAVTARRKR